MYFLILIHSVCSAYALTYIHFCINIHSHLQFSTQSQSNHTHRKTCMQFLPQFSDEQYFSWVLDYLRQFHHVNVCVCVSRSILQNWEYPILQDLVLGAMLLRWLTTGMRAAVNMRTNPESTTVKVLCVSVRERAEFYRGEVTTCEDYLDGNLKYKLFHNFPHTYNCMSSCILCTCLVNKSLNAKMFIKMHSLYRRPISYWF